jgi:hypothetical protein
MPLQATSGAASYDGFGGGVVAEPNYIESCFSTYLYTGNGSTQTITNGIDLTGKGGLAWIKKRSGAEDHFLVDTARGANYLSTNTTSAQGSQSVLSLSASGFNLLLGNSLVNASGATYASWTFRKQPKFFDVVTYTGTGSNTTIAHSLGSVPGSIFVKRTDTTGAWQVYHRSLANTEYLVLNTTAAKATGATRWNSTTPTSTVFSLGTDATVNASGGTYVAYLFAHDAGGFGLTGTDNVISCGSFTTDGSGLATINLGYEPQWILYKNSTGTGSWFVVDNMRGLVTGGNDAYLQPNSSGAENTGFNLVDLNATGFSFQSGAFGSTTTGIYIAIRRGPMKVPTSGTSVFSPISASNTQGTQNTTGFPVDLQIQTFRGGVGNHYVVDRLRKVSTNATNSEQYLVTNTTAAEASNTILTQFWNNTGFQTASGWASASTIYWNFGRAPSFFDEVCYTGTGSTQTISHNLQAVPELIITKNRTTTGPISQNWCVYAPGIPNNNNVLLLNENYAWYDVGAAMWNGTPTSTTFGVAALLSPSADKMVAYLFATCAGVSKVGSYTGTGTTLQIDCGFTAGARFILIKRTSSTGDWYVWDSARGIVSGNDPYLLLNSTAAEVTSTDYIDTYSAGFEISSTAPAAINASGGTFIFLAIA